MNAHSAEATLFDEVLSSEGERPAVFLPGTLDAAATQSAGLHAERLLAALAQSEAVRLEDGDEHGEASPALQRMEAKLDLMLGLFASLLRERGNLPTPAPLRWSTRGARLDRAWHGALVDVGTVGVLRVQPADWLPDCIDLPARVIAAEPGRLWLAFELRSAALGEALERHLFRLHRRQIAENRRQQR